MSGKNVSNGCETCVMEQGCVSDPVLARLQRLITTQMSEENPVRRLVEQGLSDTGVTVESTSICIRGLAESFPGASEEWLVDYANTQYHVIGWEASQEVRARHE